MKSGSEKNEETEMNELYCTMASVKRISRRRVSINEIKRPESKRWIRHNDTTRICVYNGSVNEYYHRGERYEERSKREMNRN